MKKQHLVLLLAIFVLVVILKQTSYCDGKSETESGSLIKGLEIIGISTIDDFNNLMYRDNLDKLLKKIDDIASQPDKGKAREILDGLKNVFASLNFTSLLFGPIRHSIFKNIMKTKYAIPPTKEELNKMLNGLKNIPSDNGESRYSDYQVEKNGILGLIEDYSEEYADLLCAKLNDFNGEKKRRLMEILVRKCLNKLNTHFFEEYLSDSDRKIRLLAVEGLARLDMYKAIEILTREYKMSKYGKTFVPALIGMYYNSKDKRLFSIVNNEKNTRDIHIRIMIWKIVVKLKDKRFLDLIKEASLKGDLYLKKEACKVLKELKSR